jgi:hypothetical protein
LNSAPAAVDNWQLKGHKLNLNEISFLSPALYNRETYMMVSSSSRFYKKQATNEITLSFHFYTLQFKVTNFYVCFLPTDIVTKALTHKSEKRKPCSVTQTIILKIVLEHSGH